MLQHGATPSRGWWGGVDAEVKEEADALSLSLIHISEPTRPY
jgi:hypothetical protein